VAKDRAGGRVRGAVRPRRGGEGEAGGEGEWSGRKKKKKTKEGWDKKKEKEV